MLRNLIDGTEPHNRHVHLVPDPYDQAFGFEGVDDLVSLVGVPAKLPFHVRYAWALAFLGVPIFDCLVEYFSVRKRRLTAIGFHENHLGACRLFYPEQLTCKRTRLMYVRLRPSPCTQSPLWFVGVGNQPASDVL